MIPDKKKTGRMMHTHALQINIYLYFILSLFLHETKNKNKSILQQQK